jgi:hypothetical protein
MQHAARNTNIGDIHIAGTESIPLALSSCPNCCTVAKYREGIAGVLCVRAVTGLWKNLMFGIWEHIAGFFEFSDGDQGAPQDRLCLSHPGDGS